MFIIDNQYRRYNLKSKMSKSEWRTYSLPKTQPTRSCSKIPSMEHLQTQPETSPFKLNTTKIYFHHLDIDFGHLDCPLPPKLITQKKISSAQEESKENLEGMQTMRFQFKNRTEEKKKPAKFFDQNQQDFSQTAKNTDRTNPQEKKQRKISLKLKEIYALEKKLKTLAHEKEEQVLIEEKKNVKTVQNIQEKKKKINLHEMMANAEEKQNSLQERALSPIHKIHYDEAIESLQSVSTIQNNMSCFPKLNTSLLPLPKITSLHASISNSIRSSQKKVVHSRIIKTYVGGSKMQLKVINYPDSSEYLKLSQKKSKKKSQMKENKQMNSFRF